MKRLWAAAALLLAALALCIFGARYTRQASGAIQETLLQAEEAGRAEDGPAAVRLAEQAAAQWEEYGRVLRTYTPHSRLEGLEQSLAALLPLAENGAFSDYSTECVRARTQFAMLLEMYLPFWENIL